MADLLFDEYITAERDSQPDIDDQAQQFDDAMLLEAVNAISDIFLILNDKRQVVFGNARLLEMLGIDTTQDILGKRPGELFSCKNASVNGGCGTTDGCRTCGALHAILASLGGKKAVHECRILQADGTALDLRVRGTPLVLRGKTYSLFSIQDISDEKRRRALERIFFHDLMNTASVITSFTDMLAETDFSGEQADYIDQLKRASVRLIDEINAQKELAAAESGDLKPRQMVVETLELLQHLCDAYGNHEVASERHIVIDPDSEHLVLVSDPTLLYRVLGNMVKNGLEACAPGETVTIACYAEGGDVVFSVHNPAFMPRNVQVQVFQRSFTTKGNGRGLGTYSIKLLTEHYLKGRVSFTTTKKAGTTFYARYPLS